MYIYGQAPLIPKGFDSVNSTRTAFSISDGQYQIDSHHAQALVSVVLSSDGQTFPSSGIQQYTITGLGTLCATIPSIEGYQSGDNVTMQIVYKSSSESESLVRSKTGGGRINLTY